MLINMHIYIFTYELRKHDDILLFKVNTLEAIFHKLSIFV